MKQIIKYKCELCGSTYDTEEAAEHCEILHEDPIRICKRNYHPGEDIPHCIEVEFSDEFIGVYELQRSYYRLKK